MTMYNSNSLKDASGKSSARFVALLAVALLGLCCACAQAEEQGTALNALEDALTASAWNLSPGSTSVLTGGDVELDVTHAQFLWRSTGDDFPADVRVRSYPDQVWKWLVNGVEGGSASTGTVTKGSNGKWFYRAPSTIPAANPVSVTAIIRTGTLEELQLVSNIQVVPTGWNGYISVEFHARYHNSANAVRENIGDLDDPPFLRRGAVYEIQRLEHIGRDIENVAFSASYGIAGTMVESFGEDGSGIAMLQLDAPNVSFRYDRQERSGFPLGCETSWGNSSITNLKGSADLEMYQSMPPSPLTFNINTDGTSSISAIPPALTRVSGRTVTFACDGDVGVGDIGPMMEAYGDTASLNGGASAHGR